MLKLKYGCTPDSRVSGDNYFDAWVDNSVLLQSFSKKVISGIENGKVLSKNVIEIPVIGIIPSSDLSGGTKTLISLYDDPSLYFDLDSMGDNCFKYLGDLCTDRDILVCTDTFRYLYQNGYNGQIYIVNSGNIVSCHEDLWKEWVNYIKSESGE